MRNLPGAEEIKQLKSALPTHSHLRALLVTQTESLGESAGLLMFILPREFVAKPHVISNVDREKKMLCQRHGMHPWRMEVCPIKYARCGMMTKGKHTVASSSVCKKESYHNTMQHVCDMRQCQLKCDTELLSPVAQWSWVPNDPHSGRCKPMHARNYHLHSLFPFSPLFFFFLFSFPRPNNITRSLRISDRNSVWKCTQLTLTFLCVITNLISMRQGRRPKRKNRENTQRNRYLLKVMYFKFILIEIEL